MTASQTAANRQIAVAAGIVMAANLLSQVTGLVRQILVSRAFGTGLEFDAFNVASNFPNLIFNLVAGGALASAFVPTLSGFLTHQDQENGWRLSSAIINWVLLITSAVSLVSTLLAPQIVHYILAPSYDPARLKLTAGLLRVLLLTPVIFGVSGLLMGILNSHQVFLWPALAPTLYWLGMIFGVIFFVPSMGIYGLAWGQVLGAGMHLLIQLPALFRLAGRRYLPTLGLSFPAVREVALLMAPRLLGVAVVQLNFLVNSIIAARLPVGSQSAITYAWMLTTTPIFVIGAAIGSAALPTFSAQAAKGELGEMRTSLAATLRGVVLLSLPATLGMILLRKPVIALFFQRGEFTAHSTDLVAWALLWYVAGLVGHSVVEVVSRAFYALHDTRTPVLVGAVAMGLNLAFSFAFTALFAWSGWEPHGGLALANSLATALEMVGLLAFMRRRLGGLNSRDILPGVVQMALATLVMSIGVWSWLSLTSGQPPWLVAGGGIVLGGSLYGIIVLGMGVKEAKDLTAGLMRRIKR
ncbi:MAG TPA: murein biosynthesis integral membrane protein MurJ [Anaerolineales bacterium]